MARSNMTAYRNELKLGETLTQEFKSDIARLNDRELVAAVVALANTEGGLLWLGVEDDGQVTGLHRQHLDLSGMAAMIANRTTPPISVAITGVHFNSKLVARIEVPRMQLVSSSDGLMVHRRLKADGTPEAVPFYPHEFSQRQSFLGALDPSSQPVKGVSPKDLDPLQRLRIRDAIRKYSGDQALLALNDSELDGALGITCTENGNVYPTLAGVLLLGTEELLLRHIPTHEVAFQLLHGTDVQVNEFFRKPLLQTFEEIELRFQARITEKELQDGLFRVPVPNYDKQAFREAFVNALVHRDYSRLGMVQIKLDDDGLTITSPGGFIEGVNLNNLLTVAPRSRNPRLADIVKRIGLAERTGRGIDRIYEGVLRYGRPMPDYSMSDSSCVSLFISGGEADQAFLEMILHLEEKMGAPLPVDSLIILSRLKNERRLTTAEIATSIQKTETQVHGILEKLVEAGLIDAHGNGRSRTYTLSSEIYRKRNEKAEYVRQAGFRALQQEQMVLQYIETYGEIRRRDVVDLCKLTPPQAYRLLRSLEERGLLKRNGVRGQKVTYQKV